MLLNSSARRPGLATSGLQGSRVISPKMEELEKKLGDETMERLTLAGESLSQVAFI